MKKKINLSAKTGLAKILARENIKVVHSPNASTASFHTGTRVCTLPMFKNMDNYQYDGFIAHEISHALHTPDDRSMIPDHIPFSFVNITEDARIEKLIKHKYPGTRRDFYHMYKHFSSSDKDFFGLKKRPIYKKTLIDRINLYFKIGKFIDVPFHPSELQFIQMVENEQTFQDAVDAAVEIYNFMVQNGSVLEVTTAEGDIQSGSSEDDNNEDDNDSGEGQEIIVNQIDNKGDKEKQGENNDGQEGQTKEKSDMDGCDKSEDSDGQSGNGSQEAENNQSERNGNNASETGNSGEEQNGEQTKTQSSGEETGENSSGKSQETVNSKNGKHEIPKYAGETQDDFDKTLQGETYQKTSYGNDEFGYGDLVKYNLKDYIRDFEVPETCVNDRTGYKEFVTQQKPHINRMIAQFLIKKSAKAYAKLQLAKTGRLSADRLADFKTSDDIFLRNEIITEEKNHGMIMYVDWSNSMTFTGGQKIRFTIRQLIILTEFCQRLKIPFEVYAFASGGYHYVQGEAFTSQMNVDLIKILSSESVKKYQENAAYLYNCTTGAEAYDEIAELKWTELNSTAFLTDQLVAKFKAKYGTEKNVLILLSDGESTDEWKANSMSKSKYRTDAKIWFKDLDTGINHLYEAQKDHDVYHRMFQFVKEKHNLSLIGFYLSPKIPNWRYLANPIGYVDSDKLAKKFVQDHYYTFNKCRQFDKYFLVSPAVFATAGAESLNISAKSTERAQTAALKKYAKTINNKAIFLKEFVNQIA